MRGAKPLIALAVVGFLVVVLGGGLVGVLGTSGDDEEATAPTTTKPRSTATSTTTVARAVAPRDENGGVEVALERRNEDTYHLPEPALDALEARSVLRITASGFAPNASGVIEQCTVAGCGNAFPVVFDGAGRARFQYLVSDSFARPFQPTSRCRANQRRCVVHLFSNEEAAFLTTVFHDPAPPPRRVTVDPSRAGLVEGAAVRVAVTGFIPGERVQAMLCAAPATYGTEWCGAPGPVAPFTINSDGTGRTAMVIATGHVGSAGASCGRRDRCAIVVADAKSAVPGAAFPVAFAAGPSARYERTRLLTGLAVALMLAAVAFFIARTTDWRKPTEADTPDLDRAVLTE